MSAATVVVIVAKHDRESEIHERRSCRAPSYAKRALRFALDSFCCSSFGHAATGVLVSCRERLETDGQNGTPGLEQAQLRGGYPSWRLHRAELATQRHREALPLVTPCRLEGRGGRVPIRHIGVHDQHVVLSGGALIAQRAQTGEDRARPSLERGELLPSLYQRPLQRVPLGRQRHRKTPGSRSGGARCSERVAREQQRLDLASVVGGQRRVHDRVIELDHPSRVHEVPFLSEAETRCCRLRCSGGWRRS